MTINAERILAYDFGEHRQHYTPRDVILYNLGVGLGRDPVDEDDLAFLDETRLRVLPTFATTLGTPGEWVRDPALGIDFNKLVHGEQRSTFHAHLPIEADIVATARVASLTDRGEGRGAVLTVERRIVDAADGTLYCTLTHTLMLRGDGGFGGSPAPRTPPPAIDGSPDLTTTITLSPRAALIYRLSGDWNPLHIDPGFARRAGFERPIMHGLGTYAAAGVAIARALGMAPERMTTLNARFAGIVMPGDTLAIDVWQDDDGATFRASVGGQTVLDHGHIAFEEWNV